MASTLRTANPMPVIVHRTLKDGRKIDYRLRVIQEPERARACGSGAKSSADRRPVDPPPVVELRIYQHNNGAEPEDITFSYSANFFLFATLEVARPMAHGRVQQPAASQQLPVLTGMPVSGMAYLDRPLEAGYFIFPDLSVRHEGMYRLSFNLYEEMRDLDEVSDQSQADKSRSMSGPGQPDSSFDWRMEVKSREFMVFSAKKFPGLAESTTLSRTVAEQGCRVRIRRDIRMRRRGGDGKNGPDFEDSDSFRGRLTEQDERERSRSLSQSPPRGGAAFSDEQNRQYVYHGSPVNGQAPRPGEHLEFGPQRSEQQPQFAGPPMPCTPTYQSQQQSYHQPQQAQPQYRGPPIQPTQSTPNHYDRFQQPQHAYAPVLPHEQHSTFPEFRRASNATSLPPIKSTRIPLDQSFNRGGYPSYGDRPISPLRALAPMRNERPLSPAPISALKFAPSFPSSTNHHRGLLPQAPLTIDAVDPVREAARNGKRTHDAVFASVDDQPLRDGARPSSPYLPNNDDDEEQPVKMSYRRAAGNTVDRDAPVPI